MLIVGSWRNGSAPAWHAGGCGFKMGGWTAMRHENPAESTFFLCVAVGCKSAKKEEKEKVLFYSTLTSLPCRSFTFFSSILNVPFSYVAFALLGMISPGSCMAL